MVADANPVVSKALDSFVDKLRLSSIELPYLSKSATSAQIEALIDVIETHEHDGMGQCGCGWRTRVTGKQWEVLQRETIRHILVDAIDRVFTKPGAIT